MKKLIHTVMVTRPAPAGEELCEAVRDAGFLAIYFPTLAIVPPVHPDRLTQQIATLDHYDWLIFISPQAVYHSGDRIHAQWKNIPPI